MRRILPHILIVLTAVVCLAVTWYFEPSIQYLHKYRSAGRIDAAKNRNYHLRLHSAKKLNLSELTLQIQWDQALVDSPHIRNGRQTRKTKPRSSFENNRATITFRGRPESQDLITGPGVLARLAFVKVPPKKRARLHAVKIVSAVGIGPDGIEVEVDGLKLVPYKPRKRVATRRGRSNRE